MDRRISALLLAACFIAVIAAGALLLSGAREEWRVTDEGLLEYSLSEPEYEMSPLEPQDNSTLYLVTFFSRGGEMEGLLRVPRTVEDEAEQDEAEQGNGVPAIVLLPGATVTKEAEQGLAKHLSDMGYASLTLDQRNLGGIDIQGDLLAFLDGEEPTEHKMVYDALVAAGILRAQPGIDESRIVYLGESNGARFAVIACALDPAARGVIAISTSGFGVEDAISTGRLTDPEMIRFYRSIDPETYLEEIPPRKLVMIHSKNDTLIPLADAERMFAMALEPKALHTVGCTVHGYCGEMGEYLQGELDVMVQ